MTLVPESGTLFTCSLPSLFVIAGSILQPPSVPIHEFRCLLVAVRTPVNRFSVLLTSARHSVAFYALASTLPETSPLSLLAFLGGDTRGYPSFLEFTV